MLTQRDNYSLGCAGLVAGTGATISVANALPFVIDGRSFQKAVATNVAFALRSGGVALPALTASQIGCVFMFLDTAGALTYESAKTVQGVADVRANTTSQSYVPGAFQWPDDIAGFACIGAVKIATNASGAFTIGTTALGAANVTSTFYNAAVDYGKPIPF